MKIIRKHIRKPEKYLYEIAQGDYFYVAISLVGDDLQTLHRYGLVDDSVARIPIPQKAATRLNSDGSYILKRDRPRELRTFEMEYHIRDWHGEDHYGTCWHHRLCFQRELIPPMELRFVIQGNILFSTLLQNNPSEYPKIKLAINVALEMLGRCEIWTDERVPAQLPVDQIEVPWEILREGTRDEQVWRNYLAKIIEKKPKAQGGVILRRHEFLWEQHPDFCVTGKQNFYGYVVYGFSSKNLFVFECDQVNNATYVFRGEWEAASKLTKTDILRSHIQERRVYHTENWYRTMARLLSQNSNEAA